MHHCIIKVKGKGSLHAIALLTGVIATRSALQSLQYLMFRYYWLNAVLRQKINYSLNSVYLGIEISIKQCFLVQNNARLLQILSIACILQTAAVHAGNVCLLCCVSSVLTVTGLRCISGTACSLSYCLLSAILTVQHYIRLCCAAVYNAMHLPELCCLDGGGLV